MKKYIILFLAITLNLNLSASTHVVTSKKESQIMIKRFASCYSQLVTLHQNKNGEYLYTTKGPKIAMDCSPGMITGSTCSNYETVTD